MQLTVKNGSLLLDLGYASTATGPQGMSVEVVVLAHFFGCTGCIAVENQSAKGFHAKQARHPLPLLPICPHREPFEVSTWLCSEVLEGYSRSQKVGI